MSQKQVIHEKTSVRSWVGFGLAFLFIAFLLLPFILHYFAVFIQTPFHFALGWLFHAYHTIPSLLEKTGSLLLPIGCLILAGILSHRFISRTLAARKLPLGWKPKDTIASLILLLSGCAAAIALSGIVHQIVWLLGEPWYQRNSRSDETAAINDARFLLLDIVEFQDSKGRYPHSLQELETEFDTGRRRAWFRGSRNLVPEPFVLLHPGSTTSVADNEPLIVSPVIHSNEKMIVGYGNVNARSVDAGKLKGILEVLKTNQPRQPDAR